ncbi:MAG: hypothetical protein PGN26_14370 [Xylophilus ampelinus]
MSPAAPSRRPLQVPKPASLPDDQLPIDQAGIIFRQIAYLCLTAEKVGYWNVFDVSLEQCKDSIATLRALIAQMGMLADLGAEKLHAVLTKGSGPEDWLLPSVYPRNSDSEGVAP